MLLAIDIGNTNIKLGLFDQFDKEPIVRFCVSSDTKRTPDEFALIISHMLAANMPTETITDCTITSVVPTLTSDVSAACKAITGKAPFIVGSGTRTGFPIRIDIQSQLGADIVSNVACAFGAVKPPFVIVDAGTATTITAVDSEGNLIGTAIAPGAFASMKALSSSCALLTDTDISSPDSVIGKNSRSSIQSGCFWGHIYMIDGFIEEIRRQVCKNNEALSLLGTGGMASKLLPHCKNSFTVDLNLTLKGAASLYYVNTQRRRSNYTK